MFAHAVLSVALFFDFATFVFGIYVLLLPAHAVDVHDVQFFQTGPLW